jgi:hypothetical protein
MTKKISLCVCALAVLALELPRASAAPPPAPVKKQTRPQYHVYGSSGTCRRSTQLLGTYDSACQACSAAAQQRRKVPVVWITTGNLSPWSDTARSYSVYGRTCKAFSLRGRTETFWKAALLGELVRSSRDEVELIYHGYEK